MCVNVCVSVYMSTDTVAVCGCCCGCGCGHVFVYVGGGGGGGVLLLVFRGKILGFVKDELPRNHLPRMLSLITNEGDIEVPSSSSPQTVWRLWSTCKGQCTLVLVEVRCRCLCRCVAGWFVWWFVWWCVLVVNVLCVCAVCVV